jgi:glycosyltransferase involved in cell wall biosynthesis
VRVVVDAVAARTGGGPVRLRELARTFPALRPGFDYVFAVRGEFAPVVHEIAPGIRTISPSAMFDRVPARLWWEHRSLPRRMGAWAPDVAFSPFNVLPTEWPGRRPSLGVIVSNLAPYSPIIRRMYGGMGGRRLEALRRLTDRTLRRADRIFLLSRQGLDLIGADLLGDRAEVIPMAPPPPPPPEDSNASHGFPDEPFFVVAGDLVRYKGVETVVAALAALQPWERPHLVICGRPLERAYVDMLHRQVGEVGVADKVRFAGTLPHAEVMALMRRARGCVMPSRFENQSRVPVEAMACGTPVLVASIPSFHEACGEAALYFQVDNPKELAAHLRNVLASDGDHRRLRQAGLERVGAMEHGSASERVLRWMDTVADG